MPKQSSLNTTKILLVDDEPDILEFLSYNLKKEKFEIWLASDGLECIKMAKKVKPDVILLDVMMPNLDGIETCKKLREKEKFKNTLIILLSARTEEFSQLAGYDAGASDYVTKPIKPNILISKIKALLKLYRKDASQVLELEDFIIDKNTYMVHYKNTDISLPKKEFELLHLLASEPRKVFTREEILEKIWGSDVVVGDRTIDVHIRKLRERFGNKKIKTVKGVGYKLK